VCLPYFERQRETRYSLFRAPARNKVLLISSASEKQGTPYFKRQRETRYSLFQAPARNKVLLISSASEKQGTPYFKRQRETRYSLFQAPARNKVLLISSATHAPYGRTYACPTYVPPQEARETRFCSKSRFLHLPPTSRPKPIT